MGGVVFSRARRENDGVFYGLELHWVPEEFSRFAFDLIAFLNGTYSPGKASSFHGTSVYYRPKED